jgi:hypothetical protein
VFALIFSCDSDSSGESSGKGGSMARFTISNNTLYTVTETELTAFDISNTQVPRKLNSTTLNGFVETIFAKDTLLFFGTRQGMLIYDATYPSTPEYISSYSHIYSCDPVVVQKNYAYVTLNSGSLRCGRNNNRLDIIDISNLYYPKAIKEYDMVSPRGLGVDYNTLFLCDDGLKVFDVSDVNNIKLTAHFKDIDAYDVIPDYGNLLMIGSDGFYQYKYIPEEGEVKFLSSITVDKTFN